ncbi:MAG: hypothetical protein LBU25_10890 [Treponema sp.]|jgi:hypothetical protein|nr:hypothetical protein [Treponema sp.]
MALVDKTFLHAFQKQAARTPEWMALSDTRRVTITYGQAQKYANHVSRRLGNVLESLDQAYSSKKPDIYYQGDTYLVHLCCF